MLAYGLSPATIVVHAWTTHDQSCRYIVARPMPSSVPWILPASVGHIPLGLATLWQQLPAASASATCTAPSVASKPPHGWCYMGHGQCMPCHWSQCVSCTLQDGSPIKFHSVGQDYFGGSHYDEYIYEWTSYKPGPVDPAVFGIPDICKKDPAQSQEVTDSSSRSGRHHKALQAVALLPGNHQQHKGQLSGSTVMQLYKPWTCGLSHGAPPIMPCLTSLLCARQHHLLFTHTVCCECR